MSETTLSERIFWCPFCGMTTCEGGCCVIPTESYEREGMGAREMTEIQMASLREVMEGAAPARTYVKPEYTALARVYDDALEQAQGGKGIERHAGRGERFEDQQIVQLGEWMGSSTAFAIGQACKKSIESTRLPDDRARAELLGAINYLSAAVIVIDRRNGRK